VKDIKDSYHHLMHNLKILIKPLLLKVIQVLVNNTFLKNLIVFILNRFPRIKNRLKNIWREHVNRQSINTQQELFYECLTPKAKEIYKILIAENDKK
jgi:hypothetical protein